MHQIEANAGGIVLDISSIEDDETLAIQAAQHRLDRTSANIFPRIIVVKNGKVLKILKKKD